MRTRSLFGVIATISLIASACSSSATPSPSTASAPPASATAPATPPPSATGSVPAESATPAPSGPAPIASIGPGEGELDIVVWPGYAEDGSNVKEYDWVHPFEAANPDCGKVNVKPADTSDDMYTLMTQNHGLYDGVSASGDASNRLIEAGEISPVDPTIFPDFKDIAQFLQSPAHNTVNGVHYGVSHGWGGNTLMYRTDIVKPIPTSWGAIFDPAASKPYQGRITDYSGTIYIADAALYLKDSKPELGITDPYELTQPQFDAVVALLKAQHPWVGKYWTSYTDEIANFTGKDPATVIGTTWQYQTNALIAAKVPVTAVVPSEGMTGWADTWMLSSTAKHPNCMLKWMAWMITPQVQAEVAEYFGEAPANPKACDILNKGFGSYAIPNFCDAYKVTDIYFYNKISFWKTPSTDCGDDRGNTCVGYDQWLQAYTDIKG